MCFKKIHLVGSSGIGMKSIIQIMQSRYPNIIIEGTSLTPTHGIIYKGNHTKEALSTDVDCVVYSGIVRHRPEVLYAESLGIPIYHRADFLSRLVKTYIGITGTHGKSYTTGLTGHIFQNYLSVIGADLIEIPNRIVNTYTPAIVEIDESDDTMDYFNPTILIIPCIQSDHLSFYTTQGHYLNRLEISANKAKIVIMQYNDMNKISINPNIHVYTYGYNLKADFYIQDNGYVPRLNIHIPFLGTGRTLNIVAACIAGFLENQDITRFESFKGIQRRFEIEEYKSFTIVNDYAVQPYSIKHVFEMMECKYGKNFSVFLRGHNPDRLNIYIKEFIEVLNNLDDLILLPVHKVLPEQHETDFIQIVQQHIKCRFSTTGACKPKHRVIVFIGADYDLLKYIDEFKQSI